MRKKGEATSHYIHFVSMYLESPSVNHIYLIMAHQALQEHHLAQKSFESLLYSFVAYELSVFHLLSKGMGLLERVLRDFREPGCLQKGWICTLVGDGDGIVPAAVLPKQFLW